MQPMYLRRALPLLVFVAMLLALLPSEARGQTALPPQRWVGVASMFQERGMPDWMPNSPRFNSSQADAQRFWDDKVRCQDFVTTPPVIGLADMTLDRAAGQARMSLDLKGAGTREVRIRCSGRAGNKDYKIQFSANARADLNGTLDGQNVVMGGVLTMQRSVSFVTCTRGGQPIQCPTFKDLDLNNIAGRLWLTATAFLTPDNNAVGQFQFMGNIFATHGKWDANLCDDAAPDDCVRKAQDQIPPWREQLVCKPGVPATLSTCNPTSGRRPGGWNMPSSLGTWPRLALPAPASEERVAALPVQSGSRGQAPPAR